MSAELSIKIWGKFISFLEQKNNGVEDILFSW